MKKGEPTAVWLEKYNRWQIKVQKNGVRKTFTSSTPGRKGQREVTSRAYAWRDNDIEDSNKKVNQLYEEYLTAQQKRSSNSNCIKLESIGRVWILPRIGHLKISKVTEQKLQDIIDDACAKRLSKKTVMNIRSTITSFIKFCRKSKATSLVPEDLSLSSSLRYKGKSVLSPGDLKKLFEIDTTLYKGERVKDPLINAYRLQVILGLRPGELLAIELKNITDTSIYSKHSINWHGEVTNGKNENAVRIIGLNSIAREIITEQKKVLVSKKYLFGDELTQRYYRDRWKAYCKANDISYVSPYELRHTFVSVVKVLPEGDVKSIVGHSKNMDTFGIYGHDMEGDRKRVADSVERVFKVHIG